MKQRLQLLNRRAIALIKDPSINDPSAMAKLGPIPAKIQHLENELNELENEVLRIEQLVESLSYSPVSDNKSSDAAESKADFAYPGNGRRASQTKLRIVIDGTILGRPGTKQEISDHKASDSLARCLTLLYNSKGIEILDKLSKFRVSRGPFVSNRPKVDYRNSSQDEEFYPFQAIGNSGYSVLTNTATREKAENLDKAFRYLGLAPGVINVEVVSK